MNCNDKKADHFFRIVIWQKWNLAKALSPRKISRDNREIDQLPNDLIEKLLHWSRSSFRQPIA